MMHDHPFSPDPPAASGCAPDEVAMKSFFLGPQSENAQWFEELLHKVFDSYFRWRRRTYTDDGRAISDADVELPAFQNRRRQLTEQTRQLMKRFENEVPKFSPRYIGHMFSETSIPATLGHFITLLHNPNNISGEASRVGVQLEKEAIGQLSEMLGCNPQSTAGHFTSGGTVANFEGLVRARRRMERFLAVGALARTRGLCEMSLFEAAHMGWPRFLELRQQLDPEDLQQFESLADNPYAVAARLRSAFDTEYRGPVVLVPAHKHYSWNKGVELLGLGREAFRSVAVDCRGRLCVDTLAEKLEDARRDQRPVLAVVTVAGTTELGTFDPVDEVQDLLDDRRRQRGLDFYHHVDAAYGGFFAAVDDDSLPDATAQSLGAVSRANSVTLDPHKLGYVPYSSGAFVSTDVREYYANTVDAPYVDFDHNRDPGPQTIEGSRSAAGAVATWLTAKTMGFDSTGHGLILERTLEARHRLRTHLDGIDLPVHFAPGDSNILTFCIADDGESLRRTNARTERIFETFSPRENGAFFVSKTTLRRSDYDALFRRFTDRWNATVDTDELGLVRLCVMNPFVDSKETDADYPREFAEAIKRCH